MKYYTNDPDAMVVFRNGHRLPFRVVLESLAHAFGSGKTNVMENDAEFERLHPRDAIGRFVKKSTEFIRIISKGMGGEDITGNFVQMPDEEDPNKYGISELSREEAEKLPNYYPESISGVKRGRPMTFEEADSGNVNPHYTGKYKDPYSENCQSCVLAFIARLRGYDVKAKRFLGEKTVSGELANNERKGYIIDEKGRHPDFVKYNGDKRVTKAREFLEATIHNDEMYCLRIKWKRGMGRHVVIAGRKDGVLYIYDPQSNEMYKRSEITYLLYGTICKRMKIFRIDNAALNPYFFNRVLEKR